MHAAFEVAQAGSRRRAPAARSPWPRPDRFDLAVFAALAAFSLWVLALDLWQVLVHGRAWTGTDGVYLVDQMQYLAWIRDASHHFLSSNLFTLRYTPEDYFQPTVAISGGLTALGVAPWLSFLLWKPVAVMAIFFAVRSFAQRLLTGVWQRRAALVLGLFFGSFTVVYGRFGVVGDLMPGFLSWGYTFGLLAVALLVFALLAYDRSRTEGRLLWLPAVPGMLATLLHPWQGELLILIVVASEAAVWRTTSVAPRRLRLPVLTVAATAIPLVYYELLGRVDTSWKLAREASKHGFSLASILLAIAPLAVPAALAYTGRVRGGDRGGGGSADAGATMSFLDTALRAWPLMALAVYCLSATGASATPLHAFDGITIPLAVLAVQGIRRIRRRRARRPGLAGALAVVVATIPATVYLLGSTRSAVAPGPGNADFIASGESRALGYLEHERSPGGVLTRFYLGSVVPGITGRRTFVGDCLWSEPGCAKRAKLAQALFDGSLAPLDAQSAVRLSGARFVLADCQATGELGDALAPITGAVHRFGCAAVYEIDAPGPPEGPLAESGGDAALRASRRQ